MAVSYRDRRTTVAQILSGGAVGDAVEATGWVKTSRFSKNVSFVHVMDGSTVRTLQVVLSAEHAVTFKSRLVIGAAVKIAGTLVESPAKGQTVELSPTNIQILGDCDASEYPLQKKRTSLEHLRTLQHLRPRTNTFQSLFRVRNALAWQIHKFFQERDFQWIHTPIITSSDCEGAGEMFAVVAGDDPSSFFGEPAFMTVSGQLEVEAFASSFGDVYTFGPTFRAENSNTTRHASEFWMIEPEIAFADLGDVISLATDFIKTVARATLEQCPDDFAFFDARIEPGLLETLNKAIEKDFAVISYDEAISLLMASGKKFEYKVAPGAHLQSEHERYLAEEHFQGPVFVTDYPIEQKSFYMRVNDDGRTVAATDLLVPRIGEIIGGSQREERFDVLHEQMTLRGIDVETYDWYLDLRRFGSVPHGGFGLGFERMLMWLTGMKNIRDVLPYPRTPGTGGL
jgi:asparaginyl-tRNA synthetase